MGKFKRYRNKYNNSPVIHSVDDFLKMTTREVLHREPELASQYRQIGLPTDTELQSSSNVVYVNEYTKSDGTVVHAHWRSKPEGNENSTSTGTGELDKKSDFYKSEEDNPQLQPKAQPQISEQLRDYIKDLVGDNIDYGFIGNESTTSSQPDVPIYPENGVIKGGISRTYIPEKDKEILSQSGGYITPTKASRDFDNFDKTNIWLNNKMNKDAYDAKQMLEIGIYGVDSYDDNDQFKHIQDGSADIFNEKYDLRGNKTIPLDMKGIEFSTDSDFSKRISENADFQQTVKDAIDKNGGNLPEKIELDFSKDSNLNRSIGHGTLLNAHKTDDGYIEGVIFDKYDYEKKEKYKDYKSNPFLNAANNSAEYLHRKNKLEYYYYFVPVRFKY